MEPTDQLDSPNRGLPESCVRRFAKRKSASRPTSIFLVNPSLFSTSPIERVGWCWLHRRGFGAPQGQSWGQFGPHFLFSSSRDHKPPEIALLHCRRSSPAGPQPNNERVGHGNPECAQQTAPFRGVDGRFFKSEPDLQRARK